MGLHLHHYWGTCEQRVNNLVLLSGEIWSPRYQMNVQAYPLTQSTKNCCLYQANRLIRTNERIHTTHSANTLTRHARRYANTDARTHMYTRTRTHARTHTHTHAHERTRAHTRTHACTHSRTHARTHAHTHTRFM